MTLAAAPVPKISSWPNGSHLHLTDLLMMERAGGAGHLTAAQLFTVEQPGTYPAYADTIVINGGTHHKEWWALRVTNTAQVSGGDFGINFDTAASFLGEYDPIMRVGFNSGVSGTVDGVHGGLCWTWESKYRINAGGELQDTQELYTAWVNPTISGVLRITLTNAGTGYLAAPTVNIAAPDQPGGKQAVAVAHVNAAGLVTSVEVRTVGSGYTVPPVITFTPVYGGIDAAATATIGPFVTRCLMMNYNCATSVYSLTLSANAFYFMNGTRDTEMVSLADGTLRLWDDARILHGKNNVNWLYQYNSTGLFLVPMIYVNGADEVSIAPQASALGIALNQTTRTVKNLLVGTATDGMTANGSLAVAQDFAHRGIKYGFNAETPSAPGLVFNGATLLPDVAAALDTLQTTLAAHGIVRLSNGYAAKCLATDPTSVVAYWDFADAGPSAVLDLSGHGGVGAAANGPVFRSGDLGSGGNSIAFDGANDIISMQCAPLAALFSGDTGAVNFVLDLDAAYWTDGLVHTILYIAPSPATYTNNFVWVFKSATNDTISFRFVSGGVSKVVSYTFPGAPGICSLGMTWAAGGIFKIYVNGSPQGTDTCAAWTGDALSYIWVGAWGTYMKGRMSDLELRNATLSDADMLTLGTVP